MSDEYTQRYQHVSHEELYDAVQAGDAEQVDLLAAKWSSLKTTLDGLSRDLSADLGALGHTWSGPAGDEFQQRVGFVSQYAGSLADGMDSVHQGLSLMSGPLRTAQENAENPEETDDHDRTVSGAIKGGIVLGPVGALAGGLRGHQQDRAEQEKAHQRMIQVVATLAESYDLSTYDTWTPPPMPPPGTPGGVDPEGPPPVTGPGATAPTAAPTTSGLAAHTGDASMSQSQTVAHGPGTNTVTQFTGTPVATPGGIGTGTGTGPGSSLAGAGPVVGSGGALLAGWAAGATGMVAAAAGGTRPAGTGMGLSLRAPTATPAGGVLNTSSLAGTAKAATSPTGVRPSGPGLEGRSAAGLGRQGAGSQRLGMVGGVGQSGEDEPDERLTWLVEDEMVWQDGPEATPPVLGATDR